MLYPFKFNPVYKQTAWGGEKIQKEYFQNAPLESNIGEAWLLSSIEGDETEVSNGFLEENIINELTEVYMGEVVGDKVYDKFGIEFPLLVKLIDAKEHLSLQVHPNNELSEKRHNAYGKSELWYILDVEDNGALFIGFKDGVTREQYQKSVEEGNLEKLLNKIDVKKGDIYYIPAGTIHAIGAGVMLAEVQQTSDITYRIFDWNRVNSEGESRELHTELALDAINFEPVRVRNLRKNIPENISTLIDKGEHFSVSMIKTKGEMALNYGTRDSFTILLCVDGEGELEYDTDGFEDICKGEVVLIPAELEDMRLYGDMELLEIHL